MNKALKRDLSHIAWNANAVGYNQPELLEFLAWFESDVFLLSKTRLTPANGGLGVYFAPGKPVPITQLRGVSG